MLDNNEKIKEAISLCVDSGLLYQQGEQYGITEKGKQVLYENFDKLYYAMKALNRIPAHVPEDVGKKFVSKMWMETFDNSVVSALIKFVGEIEPIGHKAWLEFELLDSDGRLPN